MDVKRRKGNVGFIFFVLIIVLEQNALLAGHDQNPSASYSLSPSRLPIVDFRGPINAVRVVAYKVVHCVLECESVCVRLQPITIYLGCYTSCLSIKCSLHFQHENADDPRINYNCILSCSGFLYQQI